MAGCNQAGQITTDRDVSSFSTWRQLRGLLRLKARQLLLLKENVIAGSSGYRFNRQQEWVAPW